MEDDEGNWKAHGKKAIPRSGMPVVLHELPCRYQATTSRSLQTSSGVVLSMICKWGHLGKRTETGT